MCLPNLHYKYYKNWLKHYYYFSIYDINDNFIKSYNDIDVISLEVKKPVKELLRIIREERTFIWDKKKYKLYAFKYGKYDSFDVL